MQLRTCLTRFLMKLIKPGNCKSNATEFAVPNCFKCGSEEWTLNSGWINITRAGKNNKRNALQYLPTKMKPRKKWFSNYECIEKIEFKSMIANLNIKNCIVLALIEWWWIIIFLCAKCISFHTYVYAVMWIYMLEMLYV